MPVNGSRHSQSNAIRRNAAALNEQGIIYDDDAIHSTYSALTGGVDEPFPTLSRDGPRVSLTSETPFVCTKLTHAFSSLRTLLLLKSQTQQSLKNQNTCMKLDRVQGMQACLTRTLACIDRC